MPGAARLVFVDEMGSTLALAPLLSAYTYAPKEESGGPTTVHYYYPTTGARTHYAYREHETLLEGMGESMVIEGSTTGKVLEGYVENFLENFLAPTLKKGQRL